MQKFNVPVYLDKIGRLIKEGWEKLANEHSLSIEILPPHALITFSFNYDNAQALKTLFTQEMLKRGFLASSSVYISYSHTEKHVMQYLKNVDEVFEIIKRSIEDGNVSDLLEGPVAIEGFQRLT